MTNQLIVDFQVWKTRLFGRRDIRAQDIRARTRFVS